MIVPSTTWAIAVAVGASALAAAAGLWLRIQKGRINEKLRSEAKTELAAAEAELYQAVRSGDAYRVRNARLRLLAAREAAQRHGAR